jgi:hypothetical protein
VFCAAEDIENTTVITNLIKKIKDGKGIYEKNVVTVFVQSYIRNEDFKITPPPFCNNEAPAWAINHVS